MSHTNSRYRSEEIAPLNVCPPSPVAFLKYFKSDFYAMKAKLVNSMSRDMSPSPILPCTLHMQACPYYWLEFQGGLSLPPPPNFFNINITTSLTVSADPCSVNDINILKP